MPHKRKRDGSENNGVTKDRNHESSRKRRAKRYKALDKQERVPRELTRLLSYANGVKPKSGLDDGEGATPTKQTKSQKLRKESALVEAKTTEPPQKPLKILPGERIGDYSARVDAALPVAGLLKKGKTIDVPGARPYQTKLERRMQRMQKEWREEDVKIKAQREEAAQELEDRLDEMLPGIGARHTAWGSKSQEEDPWAAIERSRKSKSETSRGLVGLHDVAQAPPQLKLGKPKLKEPGSYTRQGKTKRR